MQRCRPASKLTLALAALALACSRRVPTGSERTEPWAARSITAPVRTAPLRWTIGGASEARFVLAAKERRLEGVFRTARGELETDLYDVGRTRGVISIDLASIALSEDDRLDPERPAAEQAQNWLEIGREVPSREREKYRWARFTIEQIENPNPRAPHQGRKPPDAGVDQAREVTLDARGQLLVHGYQVELRVPVLLVFHYQAPPSAGQRPTSIAITTRAPVTVSLGVHDIRPRDARGTVLARELRLMGNTVGREAKVSATLLGTPGP